MAVWLSLKYKQLRILLAAVGHIPVVAMTIVKNAYSGFYQGYWVFPFDGHIAYTFTPMEALDSG